jgi:hypothetical protein
MTRLLTSLSATIVVCGLAATTGATALTIAPRTLMVPRLERTLTLPELEPLAALEPSANIGSLDTQVLTDSEHIVLTIHATLVMSNHCTLPAVLVSARVNGVDVEPPFPAFVDQATASYAGCSATGTFRLDLDAAEFNHPGVFLDQPLHVELTYSS